MNYIKKKRLDRLFFYELFSLGNTIFKILNVSHVLSFFFIGMSYINIGKVLNLFI